MQPILAKVLEALHMKMQPLLVAVLSWELLSLETRYRGKGADRSCCLNVKAQLRWIQGAATRCKSSSRCRHSSCMS